MFLFPAAHNVQMHRIEEEQLHLKRDESAIRLFEDEANSADVQSIEY
ncbi:MAG: hypothetical protein IGS54_12565 [Elainella sp. C42_A2020_010]|nr:hypothetical protein [Elainella sp. C42_A2020_010]